MEVSIEPKEQIKIEETKYRLWTVILHHLAFLEMNTSPEDWILACPSSCCCCWFPSQRSCCSFVDCESMLTAFPQHTAMIYPQNAPRSSNYSAKKHLNILRSPRSWKSLEWFLPVWAGPCLAGGLEQRSFGGPFQLLTFCESLIPVSSWGVPALAAAWRLEQCSAGDLAK